MNKALENKTIFISKSETDAIESANILTGAGAHVIFSPTINISPIDSPQGFDNIADDFNSIAYIVFASANSVKIFNELIKKYNLDISKTSVAVVGNKTMEACVRLGFNVDICPADFSSAGVLSLFRSFELKDKKILLPCSDISRDELEEGLTKLEAIVIKMPVYKTECLGKADGRALIDLISLKKPDVFVFTSPSSFGCYCSILNISSPEVYFSGAVVAAIGPTTAESISDKKVKNVIIPEINSLEFVSNRIIEYFTTYSN